MFSYAGLCYDDANITERELRSDEKNKEVFPL